MDKTEIKEKEFGTYEVGDKTYSLATLTTRRFEQVGALLAGIPIEDLLNAFWETEGKIDQARQSKEKGNSDPDARSGLETSEIDVDISLTRVVSALLKVLPAVNEQSLLVKFVAIALNIDEEEAADLPAKIALKVVPDFFTANKELFGTSLKSSLPGIESSLSGMILARQATQANSPNLQNEAQ